MFFVARIRELVSACCSWEEASRPFAKRKSDVATIEKRPSPRAPRSQSKESNRENLPIEETTNTPKTFSMTHDGQKKEEDNM